MWLRTLIGARWFPYVLIGAASIALIVFGWGYMKGFDSAEDKYQKAMNKALKEQYEKMVAQADQERKIALDTQRRKYAIKDRVSQVPAPSSSCQLKPECLQWFDDILRAANADTAGAD